MPDLIGSKQAEAMLRRVSPEGRERAARERLRRHTRTMRLLAQIALAMIAVAAALIISDVAGVLTTAVVTAILGLFVVTAAILAYRSRQRAPGLALPETTALSDLPDAAARWLEDRCAALPAPAITLADSIGVRLRELEPHVARLRGDEPAADAVRRMLSTELPDLIKHHADVPARLRSVAGTDGQTPDAHLINGFRIIDEEVARLTSELASGDVDALATRDRFLELKYQGEATPRP